MSDINAKCLELFPGWLSSLGDDLRVIMSVLEKKEMKEEIRKSLAGGINYLFKSLDLIPDGIDDIGYLDDAFILRLSSRFACDQGLESLDEQLRVDLGRLGNDAAIVKELLGDDVYGRLETYAAGLSRGAARGRAVDEIVTDDAVLSDLSSEVAAFISEYEAPAFAGDEKNIIKLKAFLDAKLPK